MSTKNTIKSYFHVTPRDNVRDILKHGLVPDIGPRSADAGEIKKQIYLFASYGDVEDAMLNWLGDEMEDLDPVMLRVDIPVAFAESHVHNETNSFEHVCDAPVPPDSIILLGDM